MYAIVYGNGADSAVPVTFFARIGNNVRQLDTLAPGERAIENPAITVGQGVTFNLEMWATTDATETGQRVRFGNGQTQRFDTLTCDCPIQPAGDHHHECHRNDDHGHDHARRHAQHRPAHAARVTMTRTKRS